MKCTQEGCEKEAEFTYVWPWGGTAACCDQHRYHVGQLAEQLGYATPAMAPVDPHKVKPVERDERVQYQARIFVLENEVTEVKAFAGELNLRAENLAVEVRRATARCVGLEQSLSHANESYDDVVKERDAALASNADMAAEIGRLKLLAPLPAHGE